MEIMHSRSQALVFPYPRLQHDQPLEPSVGMWGISLTRHQPL
jgi:hypothetical protein